MSLSTFATRRTLLAAALCTALAATAPLVQAADAPITIMVGGINKIIYLPAKLTEVLGYFKEEGLNVELQSQPAGVDAENQLIAGAVQGVVGFYDHTIDLQSKGKEIQAIAVFCKVPGEVELVSTKADAAGFKSMADAKGGKTLGVTGLGSSTDFLTRYLADRAGVASKEYSLLPVGAGNTFIAAMKQDRIQAGMTTEPTVSQMLKTGDAKVLVDLRTEPDDGDELAARHRHAEVAQRHGGVAVLGDEAQRDVVEVDRRSHGTAVAAAGRCSVAHGHFAAAAAAER